MAMVVCGATASGSTPVAEPGQGVSIVTDTDAHASAVLADGELVLLLEAAVGEDGTRNISVKRADGALFYAVVMDAQHEPLYKQYGP